MQSIVFSLSPWRRGPRKQAEVDASALRLLIIVCAVELCLWTLIKASETFDHHPNAPTSIPPWPVKLISLAASHRIVESQPLGKPLTVVGIVRSRWATYGLWEAQEVLLPPVALRKLTISRR